MAITLDGTLGITSPAETVQGALTTTGNTILGDAATDTLNVGAGGLVKDASGNVGIGTASPQTIFHVVGGRSYFAAASEPYAVGARFINTGGLVYFGASDGTATPDVRISNANGTNLVTATTAGLLQFNSGYGSVATAYGCRAWVNFNGTGTVAIRASGNVSSITDNGTGDYTVNFTTAMPDANYNVCGSVNGVGGNPLDEMVFAPKTGGTFSTSAVQIFTINPGSAGAGDSTYVSCSIFR
jgi:hypothetical protein